MPVVYQLGLLSFVLSKNCKLVKSSIKGVGLRSIFLITILVISSNATNVELEHHEMQQFRQSVHNLDVVLMNAIEKGHYFQKYVLQQSIVAKTPGYIQKEPEDRSLILFVEVDHLYSRYHVK